MDPKIKRLIVLIKDHKLRKKVWDFVEKPAFQVNQVNEITEKGLTLENSPAGKSVHHAYRGGLIQHTVAMTKLALSLCDLVEDFYGGNVNRDVVIASCILHDIMKAPTYIEKETGEYGLSPLGERLNHLMLVVAELYRREFPIDVIHAVAAHHGKYGPVFPRTLEALIVHLSDITDSQLNGEVLQAAKFLVKEATGEDAPKLTIKDALEIIQAKTIEGVDGVKKVWKK